MKIEVKGLNKSFSDANNQLDVICNLSIAFESGSKSAIVGRSGVGKSTLLSLLGGLIDPTGGSITVGDRELFSLSEDKLSGFRGENIGFVFQFHHLLPEFSAVENVELPLLIGGQSDKEARQAALGILERVGLGDRNSHRPGELSGGEQQRVAIARALVGKPGVVLADEPTGNLDLETAQEIKELLFDITSEFQTTLVVVTHSFDLAKGMDDVLEMREGGALVPVSED